MSVKNTTSTTTPAENDVPETRVTTPIDASSEIAPAREVAQPLMVLAQRQQYFDSQVKRSEVLREIATTVLSNIDAVSALLALASEAIAAQKTSDKTICAEEMLAQCYGIVGQYHAATDGAACRSSVLLLFVLA